MDAFSPYSIPIQGLKTGVYQYRYSLDDAFFALFEGSPIESAAIEVELNLEKRSDMLLLDFSLTGNVGAECDRCTADIRLPIEDERRLIVKYGEAEGETEDEVVFIHREYSDFNVATYLYEFAVLALPITNAYECEKDQPRPCNMDVLQILKNDAEQDASGSVWDALKGLKNN
jgi:uncharacterized protein